MPRIKRNGSTPGPKPKGRAAAPAGAVKAPKLSPEARKLWKQLAPELEKAKLLANADALTLGIACEVGAFVQQAAAELHREGLTTTDAAHKDTERRSPTWVVFQQAAQTWLAYANHLGLSPKSRQLLPENSYSPATEFAQYLMRRYQPSEVKQADEW